MREGVGAAAAALHIEVLGVAVRPALAALDGNHVGLEAGNLVHLLASGISKRVPLPAPDVAAVADESVAFVSAGFAGLAAHEHEEPLRHGRRRRRRRRRHWGLAPGLRLELGHVSLDLVSLLLGVINVGGARVNLSVGCSFCFDALCDLPLDSGEVRIELLGDLVLVGVLLEEHLAFGGAVSLALLNRRLAFLVILEDTVLGALAEGPRISHSLDVGGHLVDGADERGVLCVKLVCGGVADVDVRSLGINLRERGLDLGLLGVDVVVE